MKYKAAAVEGRSPVHVPPAEVLLLRLPEAEKCRSEQVKVFVFETFTLSSFYLVEERERRGQKSVPNGVPALLEPSHLDITKSLTVQPVEASLREIAHFVHRSQTPLSSCVPFGSVAIRATN